MPYILILYSLFDLLIIFYLYRFVKEIKKQKFSLTAVLFILIGLILDLTLNFFLPLDTSTWSQFQMQLIPIPAALIHVVGKLILAVQLIRNKTEDSSRKYMKRLGWSYILIWLIGFVFPFASVSFIEDFPNSNFYILNIARTIPLFVMILLYVNEFKQNSDAGAYIGGPTVDSEV
jgi:hypothetical protein